MKKIVLYIVILLFVVAATFLILGAVNKLHNQRLIAEKIEKLPAFSFLSLNKSSFSSSEIREGPVLIVHFHPDCEHCQYEISEIFKSDIKESGTKVILITSANPDSVTQFLNKFPNSEYQELITLIDTAYVFGDIFGRYVIPSNYLYDKELNLIDVLYGEFKIETILKRLSVSEQGR
jgi:thiol-disulfide isomerase/thioredoxin